jgi:hypothetical protein
MDKRHEDKKTGYTGIKNFYIDRQPKTLPILPAVLRKVAAFNDIVTTIDVKNGQLIKAIKEAKTEKKADAQDAMVNIVCRVKENLNSIATDESPDMALEKLTAISDSDFAAMRDTEQKDYALQIHGAAVANAAALIDYGVDAALLTHMKAAIDTFASMIGQREEAIPNTQSMRKALYALFPKADDSLRNLDKAMHSYSETDTEYYDEYLKLRPVRAYGVRHKPKPTNTPQPAAAK